MPRFHAKGARFALLLMSCGLALGQTAPEWIQQGIDAFKAAQYDEAIDNFKQALTLDPKSLEAHVRLSGAYMAAGKTSEAKAELSCVLDLDPRNLPALTALARIAFQQESNIEAQKWFTRLVEADGNSLEAHYALGVLAWRKFYPAWRQARVRAGLGLSDPGPFKDPKLRSAMRKEWEPTIQDGIAHLERALALDASNDEAMSHLNLLIRERADFADNQYAYLAEIAKADAWVKKAIEIRKHR